MSILSTNKKIINIGKEYSAGSGIDITNEVISVIGNTVPYSAGENIDIQDFVISGKDWSNDITNASANAYNETTAWVHDNYTNSADVSFLSGEVDKKLDSSAWEEVSASLATEDYVILSDNLTYARATAFTTAQEYAKESACNSAFDYLNENKLDSSSFVPSAYYPSNNPSGFITGVDLSNYYQKNETSSKEEISNAIGSIPVGDPEVNSFVESNSASLTEASNCVETNSGAWFDNVGDAEVNYFVYDNSANIIDVDTTYQTNSASYLTAHQDISNKLDTTAFSTVSGTFLTAHQSLDGYATEDWVTSQGYITGVDLSEYAKTSSVLDYIDSACSNKLDTTSFSNVSGDFLTTSFGISESAHWEEATTTYEQNSGTYLTSHQDLSDYQTTAGMVYYYTTAEANTLSSMLSGAIDYVSANAGDEFPISADEAIQYVQTNSASLNEVSYTVNTNSASWSQGGGGGASYTSPSSTIWISAYKIESTDSAYIPSHQEDVLLTASNSSINGYTTLADTNKVFFAARSQGYRISAFDDEGTFLNSAATTPVLAETEYPPIKLYTTTWVSIAYSAYSAGIMDAYVVELARKNEVNSALNKKLDSSAFTGYYPSNNPSGFAKASDVVMPSSFNLFDGRIVGINNQYFMGCDSACNHTLVGTSAATGTKTASAYVGTGHQGINIQISARNALFSNYINWTAFSENGSDLSAGQLAFNSVTNKISGFEFNSPLAENISGVKLYGNNQNFTAYSAYTTDVKPLASQDNITFLSGAIDYVSANAGDEFPASANEAITAYQTNSGNYLTAISIPESATWNDVSTTVQTNSATWNDVTSKQDNLTFGYDGQDKISSINNSGIAGGSFDVMPISGTGGVNVYEQNSVLWISGKDFTSDISYISGVVGDVETLLASL